MMKLVVGVNRGYGEYLCSKCKSPLNGLYSFVGEEKDDEGYEWRGFYPTCWDKVRHQAQEDLYANYEPAPYRWGDEK